MVNLDQVRKKLAQLSGQNKTRDAFWKPDEGTTYNVRIIPFKNNDGQPFKERYYYYNIGKNPGLLTLNQFGEADPIQEVIDVLRAENTPESKELAKKLYPKMRAYAAVIVRGEEDKGPRLWSFGRNVYQDLLNIILDEDYGDITDPDSGRDIKVVISKAPGAQYATTSVSAKPKVTPLHEDGKVAQKWIDSVPDIDALDKRKTYAELEKIVNTWLSELKTPDEASDGTSRGSAAADAVAQDVVAESKETSESKKPSSKKQKVTNDLDKAFDDIISSDD